MKLRHYFNEIEIARFSKVFLCRRGNHCAYVICFTPFSVAHYHLGRARIVFCITNKFRPVFIEEYQIQEKQTYLDQSSRYRPPRPDEKPIQFQSYKIIMKSREEFRRFVNWKE